MVKVRSTFLRITEEKNALDYLIRAGEFIKETQRNILAWKWVILSLHGALYGFAICASQGTNYENVTYKTKRGDLKLISFGEALRRCQDPKIMKMLIHSQALVLTDSQKESINIAKNELRNKIEHYIPSGWSIEIHGLPQISIDLLDVIRFLALETKTYIHLNQTEKRKVKSVVFQSKKMLKNSKLHRDLTN